MKKYRMLIGTVLLSLSLVACGNTAKVEDHGATTVPIAEEQAQETVLATVDGVPIYQSQVDEKINILLDQYTMYYGETEELKPILEGQKEELLETLINEQVIFQKAKTLNITTSDEEVEEAYNNLVSTYGEETVNQMLEMIGLTIEAYKANLKEQLVYVKAQAQMEEGDTTITEAEQQAYYDENIAAFTVGAGANMRHILVRFNESDETAYKEKCEQATKEIQQALEEGISFKELEEKYSATDVDSTMFIVEDLGFVAYNATNFDPDFLAGAKNVKEGEVSGPVKSSYGNHFIYVEGIKGEEVQAFEEVKAGITTTLVQEKKNEYYEQTLAKWKEEAKIERFTERLQ